MQLLRPWWRQTDVQEYQVGPVMAGRLRGAAFQIAMGLKQLRYDPDQQIVREYHEEELLSQPSDAGHLTPGGDAIPPQQAGAQYLIQVLTQTYELTEQDQSIAALDSFFKYTRGSLSLIDFLTMWRLCFEEAETRAGLQINNVGKSYLMLRASGLSERAKVDFRLQVGGDLNRYEDLAQVINRFAANDSQAAASTIPAMARTFWTEDGDSWDEAED